MVSDGQVSVDTTIMKGGAQKVRRLHEDRVIAGFAGSSADGLALFERFEGKLKEFQGNLRRAAVELAKDWRMDRSLRHLQALMIIADAEAGVRHGRNPDAGRRRRHGHGHAHRRGQRSELCQRGRRHPGR